MIHGQNGDDASLVSSCQKGDKHALHLLYNRHHAYLFAVARRLTGQQADAEDIVQETFVRAWKAISSFRAQAAVRTWLLRIAVNLCRNMHGRRRETVQLTETPAPPEDSDALAKRWLDRALKKLPGGYREVLVLHDVLELNHFEIAEVLGVSVGTTKSQLHRARAKMRDFLIAESSGKQLTLAEGARR